MGSSLVDIGVVPERFRQGSVHSALRVQVRVLLVSIFLTRKKRLRVTLEVINTRPSVAAEWYLFR